MNEFENGFHNENLENNRINNQENNSQQVAIDVTPIEESVTQENTESHRYSYREQGTGGSSYQYDNGNNSNDTYNNSYSSHGWRNESTYNNENYPSKRYITPFFPYIYPFWVMEVHFYD